MIQSSRARWFKLVVVVVVVGVTAGVSSAASPHPWGLASAHSPPEPPTATIAAADADQLLVADWLFQAGHAPSPGRVRQEITWARELAARFGRSASTNLSKPLEELSRLEQQLSSLTPQEVVPPPVLLDGLRARWAFDHAAPFQAGALHEQDGAGAFVGAGLRSEGVRGESLELSSQGYVSVVPELSALVAKPYSICTWVKVGVPDADFVGNGTQTGCVLLMVYRNVVRGHHWSGGDGNVLDGKTPISDGVWHHVAQVVDGKTIRLYVDGKLDAEQPFHGELQSATQPLVLGRRSPDGWGSPLIGSLDEVCFYDRPLVPEELSRLCAAGRKSDPRVAELYLAVRRVKRQIALANPVIDFDSLLLIDQPYPAGAEWPHEARHRNGMMAVSGGRLLVVNGLHPGGAVRKLAPVGEQGPAAFWRPDLSFDGQRALFCMKPAGAKSFHLYEAALDGAWHKQLTASDYDDLDPIYLPDGKILFSTTRANTYVRCMPYTYCYVLARCDADGRNLYVISQGNEPDYTPALLNDGRVVYTRWEYTDKALWRIQSLWTVNPDGTTNSALWGNQSVWPDMLIEARPIPGSRRVMFTGSAHHDWFSGSIGIIDPTKGFDFPQGLTKVTADVPWPECGPPPVDPLESLDYHRSGALTAYKSPWPLSETDFLVSARSGPGKEGGGGLGDKSPSSGNFRLYLMDVYGNRELLYVGEQNVLHAMPIRRRSFPALPDRVAWPGTTADAPPAQSGVFYCADVYEGAPAELRGKARYLRVIQMDSRTYSTWQRDEMPHQHAGPTISLVQADGVKRILGTAPIHPDGSVQFEAPPGIAMHFQLLDEHQRALQTMRSFTGVMPGERRSCVGCHEQHSRAPAGRYSGQALETPVAKLTPPPWGTETTIGYERSVQPVLEKHCASCHGAGKTARGEFDVTLRPGLGIFKEPYVTLVGGSRYHGPRSETPADTLAGILPVEMYPTIGSAASVQTLPPLRYLSYGSRLVNHYASGGRHHGVQMPPEDLLVVMAWVDLAAPYRGEEEVCQIDDPLFPGIDDLPIRPRVKTAPRIDRFRLPQDAIPADDAGGQ